MIVPEFDDQRRVFSVVGQQSHPEPQGRTGMLGGCSEGRGVSLYDSASLGDENYLLSTLSHFVVIRDRLDEAHASNLTYLDFLVPMGIGKTTHFVGAIADTCSADWGRGESEIRLRVTDESSPKELALELASLAVASPDPGRWSVVGIVVAGATSGFIPRAQGGAALLLLRPSEVMPAISDGCLRVPTWLVQEVISGLRYIVVSLIAALRIMLSLVKIALTRVVDLITFILIVVAVCLRYGRRSEPSGYVTLLTYRVQQSARGLPLGS